MSEFVEELLDSKDNIVEQLKLLKEHKDNKEVREYMSVIMKNNNSPYFKYCIDKYYYDLYVEEVKASINNQNIKLYKIYSPSAIKNKEKEKRKNYESTLKTIKKGDYIKMLDGTFERMQGTVISFDRITKKLVVRINIFDSDFVYECTDRFEIVKESKYGK